MADQAPSRAVLPAVTPEVALLDPLTKKLLFCFVRHSNKATSGATAGRTVVLSEKKAIYRAIDHGLFSA